MMPGDEREARIPSNMKDLLKFCMENTKTEDAPGADSSSSDVKELGSEVSCFLLFCWGFKLKPFLSFVYDDDFINTNCSRHQAPATLSTVFCFNFSFLPDRSFSL